MNGMSYYLKMVDVPWLLSFLSVISISGCNDIAPSSSSSYDVTSSTSITPAAPANASSDMPTSTSEPSFVEENLGLIIGVPTGLGLSIIGFIACFIYCGISALYQNYRENRDTRHTGSTDYARGTGSTGVRSNMYTSGGPSNNSAYQPSAFEPSAEPPQTNTAARENTSTV